MTDHEQANTTISRRDMLKMMGTAGAMALLPSLPLPDWEMIQRFSPLPKLPAPVITCDDDVGARTLIKIMLERNGIPVIASPSSANTLEWCRTRPVSMIISDVMKPGMSGFDMLQAMQEDPAIRHIPLMFLSARSDADAVMRGIELGADEYLPKPITHHNLVAVVRRIAHNHDIVFPTIGQITAQRPVLIVHPEAEVRQRLEDKMRNYRALPFIKTETEQPPITVIATDSTADALRISRSQPLSLVIMPLRDQITPRTLLDSLRNQWMTRTLPVLFIAPGEEAVMDFEWIKPEQPRTDSYYWLQRDDPHVRIIGFEKHMGFNAANLIMHSMM